MSDQLNIAMIGCGGMMGAHQRGYRALWDAGLREFEIVACCDLDESRAASMAESIAEFQGKKPSVHTDFEKMLDKEKSIDAVDISTVHSEHHKVAIPCFEAGKHVTMEKPLAITMRAGKAILNAADKAGVKFQIAENYRRTQENRAIHWAVASGRIGDLRMLFWIDVRERLWHWGWREERDAAGGGWMLDGGVHFADLFRYHVGPVESLCGDVRSFFPFRFKDRENLSGERIPVDVEDTTFADLRFENGVMGDWISTTAAPGWEFGGRALYGSEGVVHFGKGLKSRTEEVPMAELIPQFMASLSEEQKEEFFPRGVMDSVAIELKEFIDACLHGRSIETDGVEGYKAIAICFALYESAAIQAPVKIADIEALKLENYQADLNEKAGLA